MGDLDWHVLPAGLSRGDESQLWVIASDEEWISICSD